MVDVVFRSNASPHGHATPWSLSLSEAVDLIRRGTFSRVGFSLVAALIALPLLPLSHLAAWLGAMCVWEFCLRKALEERLVLGRATCDTGRAFAWLAGINLLGATAYSWLAYCSWSTGTVTGALLALAWICGTAIHVLVYFSNHRLLLAANLAPSVVCGIVSPILATGDVSVASVSGAAISTGILAASGMFAYDRNALLQKLAMQDIKRHTAEEIAESKTRFLAIMSHELKTPLAAVIGYSELLEEDLAGRGLRVQADDVARIHRAAVGQLAVIKNVLEMARLESGQAQTHDEICDIGPLVADVLHDVAYLATLHKNKLVSRIAPNVQLAEVDAGKLRQCLMNLLSNACKFTREGEVHLSATWREDERGNLLSFQVRDTGSGIDKQTMGSLFEAFSGSDQQLSRELGGSGLGLSIVRQFARLMGGDVDCESAPGCGSTFTLWVRAAALPKEIADRQVQFSKAV